MPVACLRCGERFAAWPGRDGERGLCRECAADATRGDSETAAEGAPPAAPHRTWEEDVPMATLLGVLEAGDRPGGS